MLTLLVPILISFLLEGNQLRSATKFTVQLHEQSLQWLMKIGPKYPQVRLSESWSFMEVHGWFVAEFKVETKSKSYGF